jgi:WD40 repeat protein
MELLEQRQLLAVVTVFDNSSYVDTAGTIDSESDNVQAALSSLGHTVSTFTGITEAEINSALADKDVLLIPELEHGDLNADLSPGAKTAIADFVSGGGGLVIHGESGGHDESFLNGVFGLSLVQGASDPLGAGSLTPAAAGTQFVGGPSSIPNNSGTYTVTTASLPVSAKSIYRVGSDSSVALIPSGSGQIAFLAFDWQDGAPLGSQDGGWVDVLNRAVEEVATPWSLGADQIVFTSDRHGNNEIYMMNADGTRQTRLTMHSATDAGPGCTLDGSTISFFSYRDGNGEIYVMNANGTGQTRLTNNSVVDVAPDISPDGSKIAFMSHRDGNYEVYIMNADGTGQTRLTNNPSADYRPDISPDGSKIAFFSLRDGNPQIYVMNADGTSQTRVSNNSYDDAHPDFSPDGSKIVFNSGRDGNQEIYVMNVDGTGQTRLTTHPANDFEPVFSPDGSKIVFTSDRDGNREIYVMNVDGTNTTRVTDGFASVCQGRRDALGRHKDAAD